VEGQDWDAARAQMDALLKMQKAPEGRQLMSPGCCAQQLLLDATICQGLVLRGDVAANPDLGPQCVRGLMACELAVALDPECWH